MAAANLSVCIRCVGWRSPRCVHSVWSSQTQCIKNLFQDARKLPLKTVSAFKGCSLSCSSWKAVPELDPLKNGDFFLILILNLFGDNYYPSVLKPT